LHELKLVGSKAIEVVDNGAEFTKVAVFGLFLALKPRRASCLQSGLETNTTLQAGYTISSPILRSSHHPSGKDITFARGERSDRTSMLCYYAKIPKSRIIY
jgi:hypothetical protein